MIETRGGAERPFLPICHRDGPDVARVAYPSPLIETCTPPPSSGRLQCVWKYVVCATDKLQLRSRPQTLQGGVECPGALPAALEANH